MLSGVPFQSIGPSYATGLLETGTDWEFDLADWNGDGNLDLFAINKLGASGTTEVSILDGTTGFSTFLEAELEMPIGPTDADWTFEIADWGGDGRLDVIGIDRNFAGTTGITVVSGFQLPGVYAPFSSMIGGLPLIPTVLHQTDASWEFEVGYWDGDSVPDLFAFDKTGAVVNGVQRTDVHIIRGSGGYGSFLEQRVTVLPATINSWDLLLGGNNDIIGIKKNGTGTNTTEVHVPTVSNLFQSYFLQTSTALHETNSNWQFEFKDVTGDGNDDLVAIATNGTGSGRTEVHVLTGLLTPPAPGTTVTLPTTDGGTVEGVINAAAGTLLIELDGNDIQIPATLQGTKIEIVGPGSVSYEGVSNANQLAIQTSGFTLTSSAQVNGNRFIIKNNSTAVIQGTVNTGSVDLFNNSTGIVTPSGVLAVGESINVGPTSALVANGLVDGDVNLQGDLSGVGPIAGTLNIETTARVTSGQSPGRLRTGNIQAVSGAVFEFELFGGTVASQYDQIDVTGTVKLGGATLQPVLGFSPALGQQFVIIRNDGTDAVSGTFHGLPEGASLNIGGKRFHITYRGGTGNDVVLQRNQSPTGGSVSLSTNEDVVLTGTVPHDDPDGDGVTVHLVSGPTNAAAFILDSNGSFSYAPNAHFSGSDSFTYRVSDGELTSSAHTVAIDVAPLADAPTLTVQDSSGNENAFIPLNISSTLVDQDGSESLSLQISGVPSGVVLNQGTDQGGGIWSLTPSDLQGLTIQSLDNQAFTLNVSATATEAATNQQATASEPLHVTVDNVAPALEDVAVTTPIVENGIATLTGNIVDPGTQDSFTLSVDWGDGSDPDNDGVVGEKFDFPAGTTSFSETHQYLDDPAGMLKNSYPLSIRLQDDDLEVAAGDTIVLNPGPEGKDARINDSPTQSDTNFGADRFLLTNQGTNIDRTALVEFDLGSVSPGAKIDSATLTLFQEFNEDSSGHTYQIFRVTEAWSEETVTWNNQPAVDATPTSSLHISDTQRQVYRDWDVTSLVQSWIDGVYPNHGFAFRSLESGPPLYFSSSDSQNTAYRPKLTIVTSVANLSVEVNNSDPQDVTLNAPVIDEDGTATVTGSFTDVGTLDTHTMTIDWGDGNSSPATINPVNKTFVASHAYPDDGPGPGNEIRSHVYNISATVADDDGGAAVGQSTVTVNNLDPENVALNAPVIDENGTATVTGSFTDVGTLDTHAVVIDWGDGTTSSATVDQGTRTFTADHQYLDDDPTGTETDVYSISATVADDDGGTAVGQSTVTVNNLAPANVALNAPVIDENGTATVIGSFTDVGPLDTHDVAIDWGDGTTSNATVDPVTRTFTADHQYLDDDPTGTSSDMYSISATVIDDDGGTAVGLSTVTVNNLNPTHVAIAPAVSEYVFAVGHVHDFSTDGNFADVGIQDTHTAEWSFTRTLNGTPIEDLRPGTVTQLAGGGSVSDPFSFAEPGVYTAVLTVTDDDGGKTVSEKTTFVVYDPSGGFVTGGGWVGSPEGAYVADPTLSGRATFGFVSKYKKGKSTPEGTTQFQFKAGNLKFHSTSYEWLVIAGARAQYKGEGTINGGGNFGFMLTAIDGQAKGGEDVDKFRIKIWDKGNGDGVVYDNQPGADSDAPISSELGGGQIVIHSGAEKLKAIGVTKRREGVRLNESLLDAAVRAAKANWALTGVSSRYLDELNSVDVQMASLPDATLGLASASTKLIWLDVDAASVGWSQEPGDGGYDLISAVYHELGHSLGFDHDILGHSLHRYESQKSFGLRYFNRAKLNIEIWKRFDRAEITKPENYQVDESQHGDVVRPMRPLSLGQSPEQIDVIDQLHEYDDLEIGARHCHADEADDDSIFGISTG